MHKLDRAGINESVEVITAPILTITVDNDRQRYTNRARSLRQMMTQQLTCGTCKFNRILHRDKACDVLSDHLFANTLDGEVDHSTQRVVNG